MTDQLRQIITLNISAWNSHLARTSKLFNSLSDEMLQEKVAPGKNSGVYLMGHLIAVHDGLLPLLGLGDKLHPELEDIFVKNPDNSALVKTPVQDLRNYWHQVHDKLSLHLNLLTGEEWLSKHTAVSEEDFAKEPHRNKLGVLISRTNHLAYHLGQLALMVTPVRLAL